MMNNMGKTSKSNFKKTIQQYWTKNVPYLDMASNEAIIGNEKFYQEIDLRRQRYEPYTSRLIESSSKKGGRMLEIGCGLGSDLRGFARLEMQVTGLDLSLNNAKLVKEGFKVLNLRGEALCSDAENLPFKDKSFDLVYSFGVLHHTPNTQKAIDEIYRVLKPNGKCVIMIYHKGLAYRWISLQYFLKKLWGNKISKDDLITAKYDHTPLSKMYSKEEAKLMFTKFRNLNIDIVTFGGIKAHKLLWWVYYILGAFSFLMDKFGSFLIIKGNK